jgi:hypothetical protein
MGLCCAFRSTGPRFPHAGLSHASRPRCAGPPRVQAPPARQRLSRRGPDRSFSPPELPAPNCRHRTARAPESGSFFQNFVENKGPIGFVWSVLLFSSDDLCRRAAETIPPFSFEASTGLQRFRGIWGVVDFAGVVGSCLAEHRLPSRRFSATFPVAGVALGLFGGCPGSPRISRLHL